MTANEHLRDLIIAHSISLTRFSTGLQRRIARLLAESDREVADKLAQRLARIEADGLDRGPATTARLEAMLAEIRALNEQAYRNIDADLREQLAGLAQSEAEYEVKAINVVTPPILSARVPPASVLATLVETSPISDGQSAALLSAWTKGLETGRMRRLEGAVRQGIVQGETTAQIVRRVRGSRAASYTDGIMAISTRSAEAFVRTAVTSVSAQARQRTWLTNDDLIKGVQYVATLDARTSSVCRTLDGKVFPIDSGPRPAQHVACRSTVVAVLKSWQELGFSAADTTPATRASMSGQVPASTTYPEWLTRQSAEVQDDVLGPTRGQLLRSGGLSVERFADETGRTYTLDDLRKRHPQAFDRAGL